VGNINEFLDICQCFFKISVIDRYKMSIIISDSQIDNVIDSQIDNQIERRIIESIVSPVPFSPTDLPEFELWFDADYGALNVVGNYFTDANANVEVNAGGGNVSTGTYLNDGSGNYNFQIGTDRTIRKESGVWVLGNNHPEDGFIIEYTSTGDVTYPWQATWSSITVTRTATTVDTVATNNQTVTRWLNKVPGKPNAEQSTGALQPKLFASTGQPRYLNFRATTSIMLNIIGTTPANPPLTYYAVLTNLNSVYQTIINRATANNRWRSVLEIDNGFPLIRQFSNSSIPSDGTASLLSNQNERVILCGSLDGIGNGFLRRVSASEDGEETVAVNTGNNTSSTSTLGSRGFPVSTNTGVDKLYEFLCYNVEHGENERNLVINYLKSKYSI